MIFSNISSNNSLVFCRFVVEIDFFVVDDVVIIVIIIVIALTAPAAAAFLLLLLFRCYFCQAQP